MKRIKILIPIFVIAILFSSCFGSKKDSVREIIREIPTISDVPKITKETKDELMGYLTI